ncbi:hypothetical protein ACFORO_19980 [Amycolatopsis halotolerans]|uniref:Uncharacterized protein n=1 Tax=Amycolatopsis halotolerans TaxID=330083 RepID=A0ABV7QJX9_9PSEU
MNARIDDRPCRVILPAELPELTPGAARALLAVLIELTEVPVLDEPAREATDDS